jgi:hypothetical protein
VAIEWPPLATFGHPSEGYLATPPGAAANAPPRGHECDQRLARTAGPSPGERRSGAATSESDSPAQPDLGSGQVGVLQPQSRPCAAEKSAAAVQDAIRLHEQKGNVAAAALLARAPASRAGLRASTRLPRRFLPPEVGDSNAWPPMQVDSRSERDQTSSNATPQVRCDCHCRCCCLQHRGGIRTSRAGTGQSGLWRPISISMLGHRPATAAGP